MANGLPDRYATNQFFNISNAESAAFGDNWASRENNDNPLFLWPRDYINNAIIGEKTRVQRGYMRLVSEVLGDTQDIRRLGRRRFHFQFNPDTLTRSVTARNDVQLWMNQDPAQFTQPIPGDANFAFEIVLNREAEVASGRYRTGSGISAERKTAATAENLNNPFSALNEEERSTAYAQSYEQSAVTDIGVIADLLVFDQIIGQGINKELINAILDRSERIFNKKKSEQSTSATQDAEDQETPEVTFSRTQATKYLNGAFGNSAFLIAQPVRVVFSSLFMVEGFITSTNVVFNKFNPSMVPTQCTISVQMQAMYIGFARKDTFLTATYADDAQKAQEEDDYKEAENQALNGLSKNLFKTISDAPTSKIGPVMVLGTAFGKKEGSLHQINIGFSDPSTDLSTYLKDKRVSVTANATLRVFYTKASSTYTALPSSKKIPGWDKLAEKPLNLYNQTVSREIASPNDQLTFEFPTYLYPVSNSSFFEFDSNAGAEYRVEFYIDFTITSSSGGSIANSSQCYKKILNNVSWLSQERPVSINNSPQPLSTGGLPNSIYSGY